MKKLLFFLLISIGAFAQPKVPYGTTGDITAESDMWLKYNFATRAYDVYFKDVSDVTSPASDTVLVAGTVRFKKLLPSSTLLSAISANMPLTYNNTTGILGINYDSLYITTDTRYFRLSGGNANITGKYLIGGVPIVDRSGAFSRVLTSDSIVVFQGGNSTDQRNLYRNTTHAFQDRLGGSTMATITTSGLSIAGGNATLLSDGRAYFGFRTSIGKAPTSNMLEVGGSVNFDGGLQLNQRVDIDGLQVGGSINENVSMTVFKNWNGTNMGAVGDFNMNDNYLDVHGYKGVGITVKTPASQKRVIEIDTLSQIKFISGKTGIAQALTINNDSTNATAGRGVELKFTAKGDTTLASIQAVTQTTNNRVGLMKFLTSNGTTNAVRMTIDQSGNVGIGLDVPQTTLHLRSDANYSGILRVDAQSVDKQAAIAYAEAGDIKYSMGKNTDNTFFLYDVANAIDLIVGTSAGNLALTPGAGRVGIGTATPATSTALDVTSTTGAVLFPRMTSTQRDALTAVNGMVIYNTTTDKLQVRAAGAWVDLH